MALLELLPNKKYFILFYFIVSCNNESRRNFIYNEKDIMLSEKSGTTYLNEEPFSGTIFALFKNTLDTLSHKVYFDGEKHGVWKIFYPNGKLLEKREYHSGSKEGNHFGYYPDGKLKFQFQLKNNLYDGFKKAWTESGKLILHMSYYKGYESGGQKVWYPNGLIKSNYIMKNGRRYGLLGTKNCINVKDSII